MSISCIEPELRALSGKFGTLGIGANQSKLLCIKKKKKYSAIFTAETEIVVLRMEA